MLTQCPVCVHDRCFAVSTADLKKLLKEAEDMPLFRRRTIVFFDEIHRLNRAQEDLVFALSRRWIVDLWFGATTENPLFCSFNNALLSRLRVLTLHPLTEQALDSIVERCIANAGQLPITEEARKFSRLPLRKAMRGI